MLTDRKQATHFFLIYQRDAFMFCLFLMFPLGAFDAVFLTEVFLVFFDRVKKQI